MYVPLGYGGLKMTKLEMIQLINNELFNEKSTFIC